jgi:squalene-hopene/tetraprenyl-beta-curcumene cyclase
MAVEKCGTPLQKSGVPANDAAIQRGVNWLRTHQRASGRWFTPSLNGVKEHYISDAATAFAVLALRACD